jgi:hypothetical protein
MDGLLDYLSPDQRQMALRNAQTQGLLGLGSALLQSSYGAPGQPKPRLGQVLSQAIPAGMQAYQGGIDQTLQQILVGQKMQEMQRQRQLQEADLARQAQIRQAMALPTVQEQINALRGLGAYEQINQIAGAEKSLRQSGIMRQPGEVAVENPFVVYQQSESPGVRKLAQQLGKSYEQGTLDDEKANVRLGEIARMEESFIANRRAEEDRRIAREEAREERRVTREQSAIERQINREGQQAEREAKRLEGTEGQRLAAGFAARMDAANAIIGQLEPAGGLPSVMTEVASAVPFVGNYAQRKVMSAEQQKYKQAADNWIRANLRKESGAVIGTEEMEAEYRTYFPMPGDTPEVIAQKAQARQITTEAMKRNAGPVYTPTQGSTLPAAQPASAGQPRQPRKPLDSIFGGDNRGTRGGQ